MMGAKRFKHVAETRKGNTPHMLQETEDELIHPCFVDRNRFIIRSLFASMAGYYGRDTVDDSYDYDPEPYKRGYDQQVVYGKPIPPSEKTCYPPSIPRKKKDDPHGYALGSESRPYGDPIDVEKPMHGSGSESSQGRPKPQSSSDFDYPQPYKSNEFLGGRAAQIFCACLFFWVLLALFVILIFFLVLHPHKPCFYVQEVQVRQWNTTNDNLLTSSFQFAIVSRNPNVRIGIYYDRLRTYVSYIGQQVTPYYPLEPFYQGHRDVNVLTLIMNGQSVPLAPFIADHLSYDQQVGFRTLNLRFLGKIRWKVGSWTSEYYSLSVNCYTVLGFSSSSPGGSVPLQPGTRCEVSV